jgi:hypothetical protein
MYHPVRIEKPAAEAPPQIIRFSCRKGGSITDNFEAAPKQGTAIAGIVKLRALFAAQSEEQRLTQGALGVTSCFGHTRLSWAVPRVHDTMDGLDGISQKQGRQCLYTCRYSVLLLGGAYILYGPPLSTKKLPLVHAAINSCGH